MAITFEDIQRANESIKTTPIRNKNYAEVNQRIKAFRILYPTGCIESEILSNEGGICVFKATVSYTDENGSKTVLGVGHAYEKEGSSNINRTSYIENCETSAVGRALGMAGFGIDVSVASYEEVATAIEQQELMEPVSDRELKMFKDYAAMLGQDFKVIGKRVGAKSLKTMTKEEHAKALIILKEIEDSMADEIGQ